MTSALLEIIKAMSSISSMIMNLSPSPSMYKIYKEKSCGEVQVLPLLSLWGSCHIWMLYGFLSGSIFPLFVTFIVGDALAIGYLSVYYRYTTERVEVRKRLACLLLWNVLITLFVFSGSEFMGITQASKTETSDLVGYIADAISVLLYASPFATLAWVIKTKSVATIPIAMVVVGTISNSLWVIYGLYISDMIIVVPNVICVTFGCVQIIVYAIYRPKTKLTHREDIDKEDDTSHSTIEIVLSPKLEFQTLRSPN